MASRASEKMNKSPCSSRCSLVALQRGNGHGYIESSCSVFSNPPGVYNPPAVPSGAAQGARGEIFAGTLGLAWERFKLSLNVSSSFVYCTY